MLSTADLPDLALNPPMWLALVTTTVGAIEGGVLGRRAGQLRLDLIGAAVFALFLGLGGGFARDTMLGNTPFVALRTPWYLVAVLVGLVLDLLFGRWIKTTGTAFVILDALTLGLYAIVGTQYALSFGVPWVGAIVVGLFASLTGGVIVALLRGVRPDVIVPGTPYAIVALIGVLVYLILVPVNGGLASVAAVLAVVGIRVLVTRRGWRTSAISPLD